MSELTKDTECQYCKQGCFRCDAKKALTDEEIQELYHSEPRFDNLGNFRYLSFARAILKKASEK